MATIHGNDQYCRYLSAPGSETSQFQFGRFLDELGIQLPLELREVIRLGWIEPILRVRLPESFYLNWEHYPILTFPTAIADEDKWAADLYIRCVTSRPATKDRPWHLEGNWYTHFLDRDDHPLTIQARAHRIPVGPGTEEPPSITHPRRNRTIHPWIDFFAYWQAYELVETLRAATLISAVWDTPHVSEFMKSVLEDYEKHHEFTQLRIARKKRAWADRMHVFEWVSRYRTLLGAWIGSHADWGKVREAAPQLLEQLGLKPVDLKQGIRDSLLTLWRDWEPWQGKHDVVPRLVRTSLRVDIDRAVDFLREATGEEIDLDNPFWGVPEDRMDRGWTPLADVLPFEAFTAKADFPVQASIYLEGWSHLLPQPLNEERLQQIAVRWWPRSVSFRRFCLAFRRLHQFFYSGSEDPVGLRESTPVDFLILCTLHAEKILRDRFLERRPKVSKSPDFLPLVRQSVEDVLRSLKLKSKDIAEAVKVLSLVLEEKAKLHDLHSNPRDPFVGKIELSHPNPLIQRILICFSNFAVLRNYMAHHDSLDDQLVQAPMADVVFEALLVVPIMILDN